MNLDKLFLKLNKKRMFALANQIFKIYSKFAKPNKHNILILSRHIEPSLLREWISQRVPHSQKLKISELNGLIDLIDDQKIVTPLITKKIAVCLSGEPRSFKHCIDSFKRFFHGHEVDIYIACRKNGDIKTLKTHYNPVNINIYNDIDYDELEREGIKAFGFIKRKHGIIIPQANPNILPMWFGIKQSLIALTSSHHNLKDYDAICRCRFDTFFKSPLPDLDFEENTIFIDPIYNEHGGYSDQFAIGHPSAMNQYFQLFDWLPTSHKLDFGDTGYLPERILRVYLEQHLALNIKTHKFETRLLRDEFIGLKPYQIPIKSITTNEERNIRIQNYIKERHPDLFPKE